MKPALLALSCAAVALGACTPLAGFVQESDNNPDCYRDIRAEFATVFVFAWPVPILTKGSYAKVCHADKAPQAQPSFVQPLAVGAVVGGGAQ